MGEAKMKRAAHAAAVEKAKRQRKKAPSPFTNSAPTSAERAALVLARTQARTINIPAIKWEAGIETRQRRRRAAFRLQRTHGVSRHA